MRNCFGAFTTFALLATAATAFAAPAITLTANHPNGIYQPNEQIVWTAHLKGDTAQLITKADYSVKSNGAVEVAHGVLDFSNGNSPTIETKYGSPGTLLLDVTLPGNKKFRALAGAVVAPFKIPFDAPAPDDFDAFWKSKLNDLAAIDPHPSIEKITGDDIPAGVKYEHVSLDNINATHVRGQLARPAKGDKFPAVLVVQYAGVYPLSKSWVTGLANEGFLALDISAHDLPIDKPAAFYKQQNQLANYTGIGNDDRDKSYFLRMFLGNVQAVKYLTSRPDWDGHTLIVAGTSQGGLQTFVTAALCPQVTQAMAMVPAGCDTLAPRHDRAIAWPYWLATWSIRGKDAAKIADTSRYFDGENFAARIHCPTLVGLGLIDETARPTGVLAAFNSIPAAQKKAIIMVHSDHQGHGGTQAEYQKQSRAWREAILHGKPLPIP